MLVPNTSKPRYRTRKGQIATNTLAACDRSLRFVYVLAGWEGSAADGRVLRDAVSRVNGLKVSRGMLLDFAIISTHLLVILNFFPSIHIALLC